VDTLDAILVPGGGLRPDGSPTEWVRHRLDHAVRRRTREPIIALSAGTTHKAPPLDRDGFPVFESVAAAQYLADRGVPPDSILFETSSYDTIGNAYFARTIHTDPRGLHRLLIITSEFHLSRVRAIFEWVFSLSDPGYQLEFEQVPNVGIDDSSLAARRRRERDSLANLDALTRSMRELPELHRWLFTRHAAYLPTRPSPAAEEAADTY
jgi:hypothetical protein